MWEECHAGRCPGISLIHKLSVAFDFVEIFLVKFVVNLVRFLIGLVRICDFDIIVDVLELELAKPDGSDGGRP
jgi:hypothetical protein